MEKGDWIRIGDVGAYWNGMGWVDIRFNGYHWVAQNATIGGTTSGSTGSSTSGGNSNTTSGGSSQSWQSGIPYVLGGMPTAPLPETPATEVIKCPDCYQKTELVGNAFKESNYHTLPCGCRFSEARLNKKLRKY